MENPNLKIEHGIEGWEWLSDRFCTYCGVRGIFFREDDNLYEPGPDVQHCIHCEGAIAWSIRHCRPRKPGPPSYLEKHFVAQCLENMKRPDHDYTADPNTLVTFHIEDKLDE